MGVKNSITLRRVYIEGDIDINIFLMKKGVLFIELECYFLWKLDGWNVVVEYAYSVSDICFVSTGLVLGDSISQRNTSHLSAGVLRRGALRLEVSEKLMLNLGFLPLQVQKDWNFLMMMSIY